MAYAGLKSSAKRSGAPMLQGNNFVGEELVRKVPLRCDVCSESRDVEYRCVECQQYYCAPCRTIHAKMTTSRHHTLIPCMPPARPASAAVQRHDQREVARAISEQTSCFQRQPLPEQHEPTVVFTSGSGSQTLVSAMCLTTDNKLWVKYKPPNTYVDILKLFDAKGNLIKHLVRNVPQGNSLTCVGDTLLSPLDWRWLAPSGESGCLDNGANDWALCSKSLPPHVVLSDPNADHYKIYKLHVRSLHPLNVELVAVSQQGAKLDNTPVDFDAASCGTVFCFLYGNTIDVHCVDNLSAPTRIVRLGLETVETGTRMSQSYFNPSIKKVWDICFFTSGGKDLLSVVTEFKYCHWEGDVARAGHVFVVMDHEDGFHVKVQEINEECECTKLTAHHTQGRLWLGDKGGQIRVRDMTEYKQTEDEYRY